LDERRVETLKLRRKIVELAGGRRAHVAHENLLIALESSPHRELQLPVPGLARARRRQRTALGGHLERRQADGIALRHAHLRVQAWPNLPLDADGQRDRSRETQIANRWLERQRRADRRAVGRIEIGVGPRWITPKGLHEERQVADKRS